MQAEQAQYPHEPVLKLKPAPTPEQLAPAQSPRVPFFLSVFGNLLVAAALMGGLLLAPALLAGWFPGA